MRTALGGLSWRPADFWPATLTEFFEAIEGHNEANSADTETSAPSENEMNKLIAKYG